MALEEPLDPMEDSSGARRRHPLANVKGGWSALEDQALVRWAWMLDGTCQRCSEEWGRSSVGNQTSSMCIRQRDKQQHCMRVTIHPAVLHVAV